MDIFTCEKHGCEKFIEESKDFPGKTRIVCRECEAERRDEAAGIFPEIEKPSDLMKKTIDERHDVIKTQILSEENRQLRAEIEAKDAEIGRLNEPCVCQGCAEYSLEVANLRTSCDILKNKHDAAEARVKELEDRQRFMMCGYCGGVLYERTSNEEPTDEECAELLKVFAEHDAKCSLNPLKQELAEAKEDTARLDWLMQQDDVSLWIKTSCCDSAWCVDLDGDNRVGEGYSLRAAIDEANNEAGASARPADLEE